MAGSDGAPAGQDRAADRRVAALMDEAGRIRRFSPGNSQTAHDGGSNANASISGGFWIALLGLILGVFGVVGLVLALEAAKDADAARNYAEEARTNAAIAISQRDELAAGIQTLKAKYEVLQYDHQALKGQLVAKGIYEGTEH